jgi:hypothetical protein
LALAKDLSGWVFGPAFTVALGQDHDLWLVVRVRADGLAIGSGLPTGPQAGGGQANPKLNPVGLEHNWLVRVSWVVCASGLVWHAWLIQPVQLHQLARSAPRARPRPADRIRLTNRIVQHNPSLMDQNSRGLWLPSLKPTQRPDEQIAPAKAVPQALAQQVGDDGLAVVTYGCCLIRADLRPKAVPGDAVQGEDNYPGA